MTPHADDDLHCELRAMQDIRMDSSASAREFWTTMYRRARVELRRPAFGRTETEGSVVGQLAHALLAAHDTFLKGQARP